MGFPKYQLFMEIRYRLSYALLLICMAACSPRGPLALFQKLSPHDQYAQRLKTAGLDQTGMGAGWLQAADQVYQQALDISLPYRQSGYFDAGRIEAIALRFQATRGQKLNFMITLRPAGSFALYADLAQLSTGESRKIVAYADTAGRPFSFEVKKTGAYLLRLQPELLKGGEYTLTIASGPSLKFPVAISGHPDIGSFWGDSRDNGGRKHEGIDIFAPKGTPALAAKDGTVTSVTENKLGGKVVFMRPDDEDYTLYYAHLGVQLVRDGQPVHAGDAIGLIDNSGNAKNTPSHLHFGIYSAAGAVDPFPFVDRREQAVPQLTLPPARLNDTMLVSRAGQGLQDGQPVRITALGPNRYIVRSAGGQLHELPANAIRSSSPTHQVSLAAGTVIYDRPDTSAARKLWLKTEGGASILGNENGFELVHYQELSGWILKPR